MMRKNIYTYLFLAFISMLVIPSCVEEYITPEREDKEGIPVELTLTFEVPTSGEKMVMTRSVKNEYEGHIDDMHVYVFNRSGKLIGYSETFEPDPYQSKSALQASKGVVHVTALTGSAYIYAIANLTTSQYYLDEQTENLLRVNNVNESKLTMSELQKMLFKKESGALQPLDHRFIMSGAVFDETNYLVDCVKIKEDGKVERSDKSQAVIKLYSVLAKNKFVINVIDGLSFKLLSYRLHNVAVEGNLLPLPINSNNTNVGVESISTQQYTGNNNSFEFYLTENLQRTTKPISSWKEREKDVYEKDADGKLTGNHSFVNAPPKATYIELFGKFLDKSNSLSSDVVYKIHLGDFGADYANFKVERNCNYTYTITIKGVNDIIVEAKKEGTNPYAEGEVVDFSSNGYIFELDSHYEERVVRFGRNTAIALRNRTEKPGSGYIFSVRTPFGTSKNMRVEGDKVYDIISGDLLADLSKNSIDEVASNLFDYGEPDFKWIHFVKHTDTDGTQYPCKYPGYPSEHENVIDVFTLLRNLYSNAEEGNEHQDFWNFQDKNYPKDRFAYYTCFIDENYYANKSWDQYVNKPSRIMHIAKDVLISEDAHSLFSKVLYTFKQRPIYTAYNLEKANSVVAFGIASISEEVSSSEEEPSHKYDKGDYDIQPQFKQPWDAWTVAKSLWLGKPWILDENDIIHVKKGQQVSYKNISRACLSRNRDLNGDGKIDENEIRWYLPSIGQYRCIWIAEDGLPAEARLFDINDMEGIPGNLEDYHEGETDALDRGLRKFHYFTASEPEIFWSEEGGATSPLSENWSQATKIRCVRTLQSRDTALLNPAKYYTYDANNRVIDLVYLNSSALRPIHKKNGLAPHYERDIQNRVYSKFQIAEKDLENTQTGPTGALDQFWTNQIKNVQSKDDVCSKGLKGSWRVPNQRELILMVETANLDNSWLEKGYSKSYWSSTLFNGMRYGNNGNGYKPGCDGFGSVGSGNITINPREWVATDIYRYPKVRCVQDVR